MLVSVSHIRSRFVNELTGMYSREEAERIFFHILEYLCRIGRTEYFIDSGKKIPEQVCADALMRLKNGEPWQYVTGETEFLSLRLKVDPRVLIPRPETEELVVLIQEKHKKNPPEKILDIGTGSGAIAIALKKFFPGSRVVAMDYSDDILELTSTNAQLNQVNIETFKGDILSGRFPEQHFDLIVSNPPYVLPDEKIFMKPNVLRFEPPEALFTPESNPILFYRKIIDYYYQNKRGILFFELNPATANQVAEYASTLGLHTRFYRDLSGKTRFAEIKRQWP